MTKETKKAIDKMNEDQLRKTSSIHSNNKEIVNYIDERLEHLKSNDAFIEYSEAKPGEFFQ